MTLTEYYRVLQLFQGRPMGRLMDDTSRVKIRHDDEAKPEHSLAMARFEADLSIQSTYFILPEFRMTFNHKNEMKYLETLVELGHEIGLHHVGMTADFIEGIKPQHYFQELLEHLRRYFPVVGAAAHGDHYSRDIGYVNWEIWAQCPSHRRRCKRLHHWVNIEEFDLKYEASFMPKDFYVSDNDSKSFIEFVKNPELVDALKSDKSSLIQLVVHPHKWVAKQ